MYRIENPYYNGRNNLYISSFHTLDEAKVKAQWLADFNGFAIEIDGSADGRKTERHIVKPQPGAVHR